MVACLVVTAAALGAATYCLSPSSEQTRLAEWQRGEARRAALRYGDLRLPIDNTNCLSQSFDNATGTLGEEHAVPCYVPPPPQPMRPVWNSPGGTVARVQALSDAFKK